MLLLFLIAASTSVPVVIDAFGTVSYQLVYSGAITVATTARSATDMQATTNAQISETL